MARPKKCPRCGGEVVEEILYGEIGSEDFVAFGQGYYPAGCVVRREKWHCPACGGFWKGRGPVVDRLSDWSEPAR